MLKLQLPSNENEFTTMMEEVDSYLRSEEIPVHARPIRGWFEISKSLNLGLSLFQRNITKATDGVYTGDDLSLRIFSWFGERYGSKLAIRMGPGRAAILVRGDSWEINLPKVYGAVEFFISPNEKSSNQEDDLRLRRVPRCNILDLITDFPIGLAKSLDSNELKDIVSSFLAIFRSMESITNIEDMPMVREIRSDIDSAASHLLSNPPHYGLSKWSSLQSAEKSFKVYLAYKEIDFPKCHKLNELSLLAEKNGLFPVEKELIDKIQCGASVRYGEEKVSKDAAHQAHVLSIILCGRIAMRVSSLTNQASGTP